MRLTSKLRKEYEQLWASVDAHDDDTRLNKIVTKILANRSRYENIEAQTSVPWFVIACIHYLEGSSMFSRQLFNGEPWNQVTRKVPKGQGPWTSWEHSAIEAMIELNEDLTKLIGSDEFDWDIPEICFAFEKHNGWGYRLYHAHVKSPYLWSKTNHYVKGKYIEKKNIFGQWKVHWKDNLVSQQVGAMAIIGRIMEVTDLKISPISTKPGQEIVVTEDEEDIIITPVESIPVPTEKPATHREPRKVSFWGKIGRWFRSIF